MRKKTMDGHRRRMNIYDGVIRSSKQGQCKHTGSKAQTHDKQGQRKHTGSKAQTHGKQGQRKHTGKPCKGDILLLLSAKTQKSINILPEAL